MASADFSRQILFQPDTVGLHLSVRPPHIRTYAFISYALWFYYIGIRIVIGLCFVWQTCPPNIAL